MTATAPDGPDDLARLCGLDDPTRRRLYDYVARRAEPVTRDEAATALGLERATAAYHLDKLLEQGLLTASFARPHGRGGPGAGRPAKHYERSDDEIAVSLPPRDYRLAAEILTRAAEADRGGTISRHLEAAATAVGHELAETARGHDLMGHLDSLGFEPFRDGTVVRLRNCPFHLLARDHTETICGMNRALLDGLAADVAPRTTARLDPGPGRCCVAFSSDG